MLLFALAAAAHAEPSIDYTEFDLDNAISLRMKGIVPGWFHYETRIRVRTTGIREISGRIRFKW